MVQTTGNPRLKLSQILYDRLTPRQTFRSLDEWHKQFTQLRAIAFLTLNSHNPVSRTEIRGGVRMTVAQMSVTRKCDWAIAPRDRYNSCRYLERKGLRYSGFVCLVHQSKKSFFRKKSKLIEKIS